MDNNHIALFIPSLDGGGAERVMVNLARGFADAGRSVDLVLVTAQGTYLDLVPDEVRIIDLNCARVFSSLFKLVRYLRHEKPDSLLVAMDHVNVIAIVARLMAGVATRLVITVHSTVSIEVKKARSWRGKVMPWFMRLVYPRADAIIAVSTGVAEDLAKVTGLPLSAIQVIYNPVVTAELLRKCGEDFVHPWFVDGHPPVLLAVGRLSEQKDFATLIRAFACIRQQRDCRLMILGEGEQRNLLEAQVTQLGLQHEVLLPGFVKNPFAYMNKADVFVLSSAWEGLVTVLIEALACGMPVVSTDCPSGSSEILEAGKYGRLVPVGDADALADAVIATLDDDVDPESQKMRANDFSQDASVKKYLAVLDDINQFEGSHRHG